MSAKQHTSLNAEAAPRLMAVLWPAIAIAATVTLLRIAYLALFCPYDLVEDEAQYWLWSQYLDWSYYSKGPGVAWVIGLSTWLFGSTEWAVRLPAAVSGLVAMVAAAGLGAEAALAMDGSKHQARRASLFALAAFALAPVFQMTAVLMTIDGPLVACWLVAVWAAWRALMRASASAWLLLGAAIAAGFLFKYTMLLVLPGLIGFAISQRRELKLASRSAPGAWRMWCAGGVLIAMLGLVPVLVWNAQHDWDTVRHLLGHIGMAGGDMPVAVIGERKWSPWWSFELIAMQIGLAGPGLVLGVWAALKARRGELGGVGAGAAVLVWAAAPVLIFYLVVSLFAEPEGNWPIAGTTTLLVLAGVWMSGAGSNVLRQAQGAKPPKKFSPRRMLWHFAVLFGVCAAPALLRADVLAAVVTRVVQMAKPEAKPIRTGRLIGAKAMGADATRILAELDAEDGGSTPGSAFVIVEHYGRASQLAFYLQDAPGRPVVYCASAEMGGRRSQFDLWPHRSLRDPELIGRSALLLSNDKPHTLDFWRSIFETVEPIDGEKLAGEHKKDRVAYIGRGYRGAALRGARP